MRSDRIRTTGRDAAPRGRDVAAMARAGEEAARETGRFLMDHLHRDFSVALKGEINLVTEVDIAAEKLIVSRLTSAFPESVVLAEEMHSDAARGAVTWIIDPLDGTTNYAHRFPVFTVSIGLEVEGTIEWGIVYNPVLGEAFTARLGGGAFLNGAPICVSETDSLGAGLLVTGFPYDIRTSAANNLDYFSAFALRAQGIRRTGSASLDFCYVAAGRFDGYWELSLHPWDCAAGYLIVREAGGKVTDWHGNPGSVYDRECLATNGRIHGEMMAVLQETAGLNPGSR